MIRVDNLTKHFFAGDRTITAVDQLTFAVPAGEVYGLLGPNGAGKTTTLRMILGLLQPDAGFAAVGGFRTVDHPNEVKSRIGLVAASDGVYPWLTVREMLLFFADLYCVPQAKAVENVEKLCNEFVMGDFIDRRCSGLSTGQKQRSILARGLVHDPTVVLLDEPTRGLDVIGSQTVFQYINYLREIGKAVVVSTHRLDEAERLCDRFGLLHNGQLWDEGTLPELQIRTSRTSLVEIFTDLTRTNPTDAIAPSAETARTD